MAGRISRGQWEQISKRVRLADYEFDPSSKCLIDGRRFLGNDCTHTADDQDAIIQEVIKRDTTRA